jgi:hypothetical protein
MHQPRGQSTQQQVARCTNSGDSQLRVLILVPPNINFGATLRLASPKWGTRRSVGPATNPPGTVTSAASGRLGTVTSAPQQLPRPPVPTPETATSGTVTSVAGGSRGGSLGTVNSLTPNNYVDRTHKHRGQHRGQSLQRRWAAWGQTPQPPQQLPRPPAPTPEIVTSVH